MGSLSCHAMETTQSPQLNSAPLFGASTFCIRNIPIPPLPPSPPPPLPPRLVWTQVAKKLSVHLYFIDRANKWIWFRLRFFWTAGGAKSGATRRNHYNDIHIFLHGYNVVLANELASLIVSNLNLVSLSEDVPNIVPWAFVSLVGVSIMRTSRIRLLFPLDKTIVYETTVFC